MNIYIKIYYNYLHLIFKETVVEGKVLWIIVTSFQHNITQPFFLGSYLSQAWQGWVMRNTALRCAMGPPDTR